MLRNVGYAYRYKAKTAALAFSNGNSDCTTGPLKFLVLINHEEWRIQWSILIDERFANFPALQSVMTKFAQ